MDLRSAKAIKILKKAAYSVNGFVIFRKRLLWGAFSINKCTNCTVQKKKRQVVRKVETVFLFLYYNKNHTV